LCAAVFVELASAVAVAAVAGGASGESWLAADALRAAATSWAFCDSSDPDAPRALSANESAAVEVLLSAGTAGPVFFVVR